MADAKLCAEVFEIFDSGEQKGRGLRASKSLTPGDKVLESTPLVYVLCNSVRGLCCDFCFAKSEDLQRCSKCKFARYCNRECQKSAWKDHKTECELTLNISPNIPTDLVRLMARITQQEQSAKPSVSSVRSVYSSLVFHSDKFDDQRKEAFSAILVALKLFLGEGDFHKYSDDHLFALFGKISCNSFTICDAELQPLGMKDSMFIIKIKVRNVSLLYNKSVSQPVVQSICWSACLSISQSVHQLVSPSS